MELAFSQNPYYITVDKSSGLPSNSIYDIFQDSKGFMWFASGKGLCRYDGNFTKIFTADFQTSKSGSCIQEDKYGRIWYENFDGFLYYVQNDKLKSLSQNKPMGYFRYGITDNHLAVVEVDGVRFYDLKTLKSQKKILIKFNYLQFVYNKEDTLYIFDDKLYEVDTNGIIKSYKYPKDFLKEFNSPIVQKIDDGIVIISKFNNKYCFFKNGKFEIAQFNFSIDFVQNLATTKNNIWLCTTKGIIAVNTKSLEKKSYFSDKNISFIYLDKQNNYWISTINEGVFFIENFDTKIIELPSKPTILSKSKTAVLVGVENDEVYAINPNNYTFKSIYSGKLNHGVNQLFYDEESGAKFLTSSSFKVISNQKTEDLRMGAVKSIAKIDEKYFSFAASNISGVFTTNKNLKSKWDSVFESYISNTNADFSKTILVSNSNGKSTIYNPINQTIYFATNNGLISLSKAYQKEIKYRDKTTYFTKIGYYNGIIYGFSNNEVIYTVNSKNKIKPYKIPYNFIKEKIERITVQKQLLFIITDNNVYEINLDNNVIRKIISVTKDISITDVELLNNNYYFASSRGIIVKRGTKNRIKTAPKLFINNIIVNDTNIIAKNAAELQHTENNITINFTVLTTVPNEKHQVLYNINNSKWKTLDAENKNLVLLSLSPDDYEIKLKIDDKNSSVIETINFTIKKPIWLKPFFLLALGVFSLLFLFSIYKWQILKIQKQNQLVLDKLNLEKNANHAKLKAIKSQMNPHFFYNALNTLQSYILSNEMKQAIEYLSKFSNLTRTILEMTEKDFISVSEEIKTLKLYLDIEKVRFETDFNYKIITNYELESDYLKIPTMLLQPYVENAIKHGLLHKIGKKELKISFQKEMGILKICIDDNGIGRKKSAKLNAIKNKNHVSFASEATQNRINLLNQYTNKNISVYIIDKINSVEQSLGTIVIFEIPIS